MDIRLLDGPKTVLLDVTSKTAMEQGLLDMNEQSNKDQARYVGSMRSLYKAFHDKKMKYSEKIMMPGDEFYPMVFTMMGGFTPSVSLAIARIISMVPEVERKEWWFQLTATIRMACVVCEV